MQAHMQHTPAHTCDAPSRPTRGVNSPAFTSFCSLGGIVPVISAALTRVACVVFEYRSMLEWTGLNMMTPMCIACMVPHMHQVVFEIQTKSENTAQQCACSAVHVQNPSLMCSTQRPTHTHTHTHTHT